MSGAPVICHSPMGAVGAAVAALEDALVPDVAARDGFYGWVPLPMPEFLAAMGAAIGVLVDEWASWPPAGVAFLDAGCGIGTKLVVAQALGFRVAGIDHEPAYLGVARRLCPAAELVEADAATFDGYGDFEVVYSFRLCVDLDAQHTLTGVVASAMRPGALLVAAGWDPVGLEPVADYVWRV